MADVADNTPAIAVQALTKRYGAARGVEAVTFTVDRGEVFGFLGPNGAGKTTTIRCLMGLLAPTEGACHLLGERVRIGAATMHERVGYLPGDFRVWPRLTAGRCLRVLASLAGRPRADNGRLEPLAERVGLDLDRPVGDLSKGNRQKVGVVYAFQHEPEVLILDEPTSGLDPLVRQTVLEMVREAAARGVAVMLSSHDLAEVASVCSRAAIIREGRLVELAPIEQIVHQGENQLQVWFTDGVAPSGEQLAQLPDVRVVARDDGMLHLAYHGAADDVLKWLAQYPVDRIATPTASLEEAFVQYYAGDREASS